MGKPSDAEHDLECDDDEQRFLERLEKLVKYARERGVPERK